MIPIVIYLDLYFGAIHDYLTYLHYWQALLIGQNPYYPTYYYTCVYPPLFLIFAPLILITALLPKIIFSLIWLLTAHFIDKLCLEHNKSMKERFFYVGLILFNPLYWICHVFYSFFDCVVGLLLLFSIYLFKKKETVRSAISAAVAFLFKYAGALLFLPIIFFRKINWKVILSIIIISGGVYFILYFVWGEYIFYQFFGHTVERSSQGYSIFRAIRGPVIGINLDKYNIYITAGLLIIVFLICIRYKVDILETSIISFLIFWTFFEVAHTQFIFWFFPLIVYLCLELKKPSKILNYYLVIFSLYFIIMQIIYIPTGFGTIDPNFLFLRNIIGFFNFVLTIIFIIIIIYIHKYRKSITNSLKQNSPTDKNSLNGQEI